MEANERIFPERFLLYAAVILVMAPAFASAHDGGKDCAAGAGVLLERKTATASLWKNVWKSEGSIRFETVRMLTIGLERLETEEQTPSDASGSRPVLVFESVPAKVRRGYEEESLCGSKLAESATRPFVREKVFASLDELQRWYSDFTQGKGPDGKQLYDRCDGGCSPRYKSFITRDGDRFAVRTEAVCGHARDKDDNQYYLTLELARECERA